MKGKILLLGLIFVLMFQVSSAMVDNIVCVDDASGKINTPFTVECNIHVDRSGDHFLELGLEKGYKLSIASIDSNSCDPNEIWYSNGWVDLDSGWNTVKFKAVPINCNYPYSNGKDCGTGTWTWHVAEVFGTKGSDSCEFADGWMGSVNLVKDTFSVSEGTTTPPPTNPPEYETSGSFTNVFVDKDKIKLGETVTVTGEFYVTKAGNFNLEAGMGKTSNLFQVISIKDNACGVEPWFANKKSVPLSEGRHLIEFELKPNSEGNWNFWVNQFTDCGGESFDQYCSEDGKYCDNVSGEGLVQVGDKTIGGISVWTITAIIIGATIILFGISMLVRKKKGRR